MAFKLDDIIIDRVQYGVAEDNDGNLLYVLTQLSEATIDITAESKDALDAQGTLIKRFWQGKSGEFTANNAMINLNVLGAASGEAKVVASADMAINMPKIFTVDTNAGTVELPNFDGGTVAVNILYSNGAMGKGYALSSTPGESSETEFGVSGNVLKLPTLTAEEQAELNEGRDFVFIVKYNRTLTDKAVAVHNKADKFPGTVKLTLKALAVDPCDVDTLRACYIVIPSFQVSPEVSLSLTTDGEFSYSGSLQVNYCSKNKELYSVYFAEEDEE